MGTEGIRDRYINPYTDFGFKKLFGTDMNKELLISFLNALLEGKEEIEEITYLNVEQMGDRELDRRAVFDVYCRNSQGERFLVEMQKGEQEFFKDRGLYYTTFPIREQAKRGSWDYELKGVYTIAILNFVFDNNDPACYRHDVKLVDLGSGKVFYDKLTFIYLEMPKFNKQEDELDGMFEKWLFVLRNLSRLMERPKALQERIFNKLFEAAEIAKFTKVEYDNYEESLKVYRDWVNTINTAKMIAAKEGRAKGRAEGLKEGRAEGLKEGREKGLQEGREKGLQEGREKGLQEGHEKGLQEGIEKGCEEGLKAARLQMAAGMKSLGIPVEEIARVTQLGRDEIETL